MNAQSGGAGHGAIWVAGIFLLLIGLFDILALGGSFALSYVDALRTGRLWADMIAAQRDVFGQHGFARLDKPGRHHANWAPYVGDDRG